MGKIRVFVLGASAGGLEALQKLVSKLPGDFPAAVCVVVHVAADSPGLIPEILSGWGPLPARHARDGDALTPGTIFVAPPDYHLLIDRNLRAKLGRGPKENRFRPAIDPLFRSAAVALDGHAAGIVLSGGLDDGVAGLVAIQRCGGATIVQDPSDAFAQSMPRAALRAIKPDKILAAADMAAVMMELAHSYERRAPEEPSMANELDKEIRVAAGADSKPADVLSLGEPSLFTCPDCHGALVRLRDDAPIRFRCHTGHAYTVESLEAAVHESVEESLWNAIRSLEEFAALLDHTSTHGATSISRADAKARAVQVRNSSNQTRDVVKALAGAPVKLER